MAGSVYNTACFCFRSSIKIILENNRRPATSMDDQHLRAMRCPGCHLNGINTRLQHGQVEARLPGQQRFSVQHSAVYIINDRLPVVF